MKKKTKIHTLQLLLEHIEGGKHTFFMAKIQLIFVANYSFKCTQLLIKRLKWENRTNGKRINQMLKSAFLANYCHFHMKSHNNCVVPLSLIEWSILLNHFGISQSRMALQFTFCGHFMWLKYSWASKYFIFFMNNIPTEQIHWMRAVICISCHKIQRNFIEIITLEWILEYLFVIIEKNEMNFFSYLARCSYALGCIVVNNQKQTVEINI